MLGFLGKHAYGETLGDRDGKSFLAIKESLIPE